MDLSFVPLPNVRPGDKSPRDRSRSSRAPRRPRRRSGCCPRNPCGISAGSWRCREDAPQPGRWRRPARLSSGRGAMAPRTGRRHPRLRRSAGGVLGAATTLLPQVRLG